MVEISPDVEQLLADLSDAEWAALTAKVRAPDAEELYRKVAKYVVPEQFLDNWMQVANVAAFVNADGTIDEERLRRGLNSIFSKDQTQSTGGDTSTKVHGRRQAVADARRAKDEQP